LDPVRAAVQHDAYEATLAGEGWEVRRLPPLDDHPDAVFVEDVAVVVDEIAILTRPGAPSRRGEVESAEPGLRPLREIARMHPPGMLDGGDVLRVGRRVWVGRSSRTDAEGARQLRAVLAPLGYEVREVSFEGCLHLKTAATAATEDLVVVNPRWVDPAAFAPLRPVPVDPAEPFAANVLRLGETVFVAADAPRTMERLRDAGIRVAPLDMSELAKAEGGLTCCSILLGA
ncbi:MAG TPA: N(G),N(G)-dimethylarginine dimethylaminohydrolase, partial [Gemmatimonadaceae bacterium]